MLIPITFGGAPVIRKNALAQKKKPFTAEGLFNMKKGVLENIVPGA